MVLARLVFVLIILQRRHVQSPRLLGPTSQSPATTICYTRRRPASPLFLYHHTALSLFVSNFGMPTPTLPLRLISRPVSRMAPSLQHAEDFLSFVNASPTRASPCLASDISPHPMHPANILPSSFPRRKILHRKARKGWLYPDQGTNCTTTLDNKGNHQVGDFLVDKEACGELGSIQAPSARRHRIFTLWVHGYKEQSAACMR